MEARSVLSIRRLVSQRSEITVAMWWWWEAQLEAAVSSNLAQLVQTVVRLSHSSSVAIGLLSPNIEHSSANRQRVSRIR